MQKRAVVLWFINMEPDQNMQEVIDLIADISDIQARYLNEVREQTLDDLEELVR